MLLLVLPHRHLVGAVEEDVAGHQDGIREQTSRDALAAVGSAGFVLVLRHAFEPAERRHAVQEPARLRVSGQVALDEHGTVVGINPGRDVQRRDRPRAMSQGVGVVRDSYGVEVDDAEVVLLLVLPLDPPLDRAEVVAEVKVAGGLYAAQDALLPRLRAWVFGGKRFQFA